MNKKARSVLFVGPVYMDIYKDVIAALETQGYIVDFIQERQRNNDPLSARYEYYRPHFGIERKKENYWRQLLAQPDYQKAYDLLLVIDGQGLHPVLFDTLKERNSQVKCVNYLFDTTYGVYHFETFFNRFDRVFTFDRAESEHYGIGLLPIYWVDDRGAQFVEEYAFFGFGAYNENRFEVFSRLYGYAEKRKMPSFVKLFEKQVRYEWLYEVKRWIRKMMGLPAHLPLSHYHSPIITQSTIAPKDFRTLINRSHITVDTHPGHQDGLTARFMWALGAGKKIVTTNESVARYEFYTPEQIFILHENTDFETDSQFSRFVTSPLDLPNHVREKIDQYRIDNWLKTLCEF